MLLGTPLSSLFGPELPTMPNATGKGRNVNI
jgi:hypothetical protein